MFWWVMSFGTFALPDPPATYPCPGESSMSATVFLPSDAFVDRRTSGASEDAPGRERRQFANSHEELSPEAGELARAIDGYKLQHRRRFITFEEMLAVIKSLGYQR
jgi:hypothetical protein